MESWQKELLQAFEIATQEAEQFFFKLAEVLEETLEEVAAEIDQVLTETVEPVLNSLLEWEGVIDEAAQPVIQTWQPMLQDRPACIGCHHYHGQSYGGHVLVCAMHPYGYDDETCPDWQSTLADRP